MPFGGCLLKFGGVGICIAASYSCGGCAADGSTISRPLQGVCTNQFLSGDEPGGGSGNGVLVQGAQRHCPAALLPNLLLLRAAKSGIMSTKATLK